MANYCITLPAGTGDDVYLNALRDALKNALSPFRAELVFYIAGNDVLKGDALGDFELTPEGVLMRDRLVAQHCVARETPLLVTLAGGYSENAWACSANFLRWALTDDVQPQSQSSDGLRHHFRRVAANIDPLELKRDDPDDWSFTEEEILGDLNQRRGTQLVLDYYTVQGVEFAFERYGILKKIRERGYTELRLEGDPSDPGHQVLRIYGDYKYGGETSLLVEIVARRRFVDAPQNFSVEGQEAEKIEVLMIEWLLLQDPHKPFSIQRPRLPGQKHRGLGIAVEIQEMLIQLCRRLGLVGILDLPSHLHSGTYGQDYYGFIDARQEGRIRAMRHALAGFSLAHASWLAEEARVYTQEGEAVEWKPEPQILAVDKKLKAYYDSKYYIQKRDEEFQRLLDSGIHVRDPERLPEGLRAAFKEVENET